jgi:hypothetical protein
MGSTQLSSSMLVFSTTAQNNDVHVVVVRDVIIPKRIVRHHNPIGSKSRLVSMPVLLALSLSVKFLVSVKLHFALFGTILQHR